MSLVLLAFTSFFVALSGALVPGPLFTITVAESAKRGFVAGPLIILGHGILELLMISLLLIGLTPFLNHEKTITVITLLGGAILIFMGYGTIRNAQKATLVTQGEPKSKGLHPVMSGVLGSISNPYWTIWWVTIGVGYLISSLKFGMMGVIVFFVGHILADLGWYSLISLGISKGRTIIGDRGYRGLMYACGIFLVLFGVWFMTGL